MFVFLLKKYVFGVIFKAREVKMISAAQIGLFIAAVLYYLKEDDKDKKD